MARMISINDVNYRQFVNPVINGETRVCKSFGMWLPRSRGAPKPFEAMGIPVLPESSWDERIEELERNEATLRHLCDGMELECLDQKSTSYCWVFGPTMCCMITRLRETGREYRLSPASAGAPIKNFQNRGGWGEEALNYFVKYGLNEQADWPETAIDRRYYTDENRRKALAHRVLEYYRIDTWLQMGSVILHGIPVSPGYNWWAHQVTGVHVRRGDHALLIRNSWGRDWSDDGYGWLEGNKRYPDGCVAITTMAAL